MQRTLSPNNGCAKTVQLVPLVIPGVFTTDQRPLLGVEPDWHGAVWESQQPLCVDSDPSRKTLAPSLIFFMPLCRPRDLIRCPTNPGWCAPRTRTAAGANPDGGYVESFVAQCLSDNGSAFVPSRFTASSSWTETPRKRRIVGAIWVVCTRSSTMAPRRPGALTSIAT